MAKFSVILPAAGRSSRFKMRQRKKQFADLKGRAVWVRAAEHFVNHEDVLQTILVISAEDMDWFKEKFAPNLAFMDIELVEGGTDRTASVQHALHKVDAAADFVAVHDAARPLLAKQWIDRVFRAAEESGAAILATAVTSTLKRVHNGRIQETVSRDSLWEAQTPQVFRRDWLAEAYAQLGDMHPTDEAQLIEQYGKPVTVVEGSPMNFKITTSDDFKLAEVTLNALPKEKGLSGLHPFADEEPRLI